MYCSSIKVVIFCLRKACSSVEVYKNLPFFRFGCSFASNLGEFYQFNLSSCIRQQNSLTAQFVSFSLSNLANIFYPPNFYNN